MAATLRNLNIGAYLVHEVTFYFLLCYRPFGIQFHVETSLFSVYFAKLERGTIKPVRWGVSDEHLDQVKSFGVKKFEDFTWKHMLDFYSCADCGRCADNCPANAVGRPLAPRFITIKARDYVFQHYPVLGKANNSKPLIGNIYSEDEIWSCTTCGACEEECPLLVEYIDKIVDLRRGMIDDGNVPQSLQKPLKALESRGNPYGKLEKKKADWAKVPEFQKTCRVKILDGKNGADTLYFVDSITSYDDRMQSIGRSTARILDHIGENFGILGAAEKDSGHEVRRFGEEMLFMALRDHNTDAIKASGVERIVTADPHAFNALKHDYKDIPPVEHISQVIAREVKAGNIRFNRVENEDNVYAYHDPCYLGRHNQVYDEPRDVLDAIPGLKRVEMKRSRDRSFCCGGGGLMLFYEPKEEQRMGVLRVRMAAEAGANVIVTACPFCMVNIEDAIKVAGLEGKMCAIDLTELVDQNIVRANCTEESKRQLVEADVEILVCARRVPDTSENEIALNPAGNDIERDELVYSVNEPDNYAVEEALQIRDRVGGNVTVVTIGGEDDEEILRRELAMGANQAALVSDEAFSGSDGKGIATILKNFVQKGHFDLILTGVQADDGAAQVGGMLAAMLDYPFASLVNGITVEDGKLKVSREIEGGNREISEIDLPCVLSIQTGINEPRYVGMRGIRQVASVPIPTFRSFRPRRR